MTYVKKIAFSIFAVALFAAMLPAFATTADAQTRSATTVGVQNVSSNSASLTGNSNFVPDNSWFEFGTTPSMGYSIDSNNGVGQATGLQPGKTYYYRYVAQEDGITCYGETKSFTTPSSTPVCTAPVATTGSYSNLTSNSATITGSKTGTVTRTWFEFGDTSNTPYSIADNGGSGSATGLQPSKTYYYRYVVQNECGTSYGEVRSFTTLPSGPVCTAPVATTGSASNLTSNSATISGSKTGTVTRTWFEFGDTSNTPYSIADNGGSGSATGLQPSKTYYYRYVVQNECGTSYGEVRSFTTLPSGPVCTAPVATTGSASNLTSNSATISGSKTGTVTRTWFEFGETSNTPYSIADNGGYGTANGLQAGKTYYYRYVVQNECGTSYGEVRSFTTPTGPVVCPLPAATTGGATNITRTTATISGRGDGTSTWFEYGTSASNLSRINTASYGSDVNLTGLTPNTTYTYRLVSQNECGTTYGSFLTFTTPPDVVQCPTPTATTGAATNVAQTSATISGTASNASSAWMEYGTSSGNMQRINVSASGGSVNLTGLTPNTTYTYRIVAQSECGTDYGTFRTFTTGTQCVAPTATTGAATNVAQTSATISGTASNAASAWMEYGTSAGNMQRVNVSASGGSVNLTGLTPNTTYTYRIVAQSECGTDYGTFRTFNTPPGVQCIAPSATVYQATSVTQTSAIISGVINTQGRTGTYYFQYGTNVNSMNQVTQTQAVNGSSQNVSYTLTGLSSNTTYYYRLVVQTDCGTDQSNSLYFTTGTAQCLAPIVVLTNATNVTQNTAVVSGTVDPRGGTATYYFQYGTNQNSLSNYTQTYSVSGNGTQNVTVTIPNLQSNTTYYFRLIAQNSCGTNQSQISYFTTTGGPGVCTAPTVSVYAATNIGQNTATLNGNVNGNGYPTTYWFRYGTSYSFGYTSATQGPINGSQTVSAPIYSLTNNANYYFSIVAQNECGTTYGQSTLQFNTSGGQPQGQGPIANTNPATNIGNTSAILNGRVNPNGATATAWFEWGQTTSLGYVTNSQSIGSGNSYVDLSMPVSGLQSGRTYYFRVMGQNQYGTAQGQILSFTTGTGGTVVNNNPPIYTYRPPVVVTTVSGGVAGTSCLVLTPAIQPSNPIPGGEFTYSVTYRNDCPFDLQNASLRNYMPNETDFAATSYPFLTRDLNVITYSLGTIPRGFQNTILVKGLVRPTVMPGNNLVFKSDLAFADPRGQIQTVSAFLTATTAAVGVMTASVFDTLMHFFSSGWFWFLLFLLLLALFVLWLASRRRHDDDLEHA